MNHKFIFYLDPGDISGETAIFNAAESHHISGVLRLGAGCEVDAVDGHGSRYHIRLLQKQESRWQGVILATERVEPSAPLPLWLALPCLKSDRWELALEAACELGIQRIYPTQYRNAACTWTPSRLTKARRKAVEALKQAGGCCLTEISQPLPLDELLSASEGINVYVAHSEGPPLTGIAVPALLLIGPEAGFHAEDEKLLRRSNVHRFNLGTRRLRSEIACVAALAQAAINLTSS